MAAGLQAEAGLAGLRRDGRRTRRGFRGWVGLVADKLFDKDLVLLAVLPHPFLHLDVMTVLVIDRRIIGRIDRRIIGVINPGETDMDINAGRSRRSTSG